MLMHARAHVHAHMYIKLLPKVRVSWRKDDIDKDGNSAMTVSTDGSLAHLARAKGAGYNGTGLVDISNRDIRQG